VELAVALGAQAVAIIAAAAGLGRWYLGRHLSGHDQLQTLERVASWFPDQVPGAPESLPAKVDRVESAAVEALEVAKQTGSDLLAHMREEERLRVADVDDRRARQAKLDQLIDQLTAGNPEVRHS